MKNEKAKVDPLSNMEGIKSGKGDSVTFLLKVAMHCQCIGCTKKIRKGIGSITNFHGVEKVEPNMESGEVKVVGKVKPEKLRDWLHKKINKRVDLVYPTTLLHQNDSEETHITYPAPSAPPISFMFDQYEYQLYRGSNRE